MDLVAGESEVRLGRGEDNRKASAGLPDSNGSLDSGQFSVAEKNIQEDSAEAAVPELRQKGFTVRIAGNLNILPDGGGSYVSDQTGIDGLIPGLQL